MSTDASSPAEPTPAAPPHPALWWLLWLVLLIGLGVTVLLLVKQTATASGEIGLPGCSTGGKFDCDRVLSSAFGKIGGWPITWFALGYYALAAASLSVAAAAARWRAAPLALFAPLIVGALGLATAVWSLYVMAVELKSLCPYCLAVHAANMAFFLLAGPYCVGLFQSREVVTGQPHSRVPAIVAGVVTLAAAAWQWTFLSAFHDPVVLEVVVTQDVLVDELRLGGSADGPDTIWTQEGAREAQNVVVMFSCFTCPNCKETHKLLNEILAERPGKFRIDLRMNPLAAPCNPHMAGGAIVPAHANACRLARVAVAVAAVDPAAFPGFADWLYSKQAAGPGLPGVLPFEAEDEATRRVDGARLKAALQDDDPAGQRVVARLKLDMDLSLKFKVPRVPQVYVGRIGQSSGDTPAGQLSGEVNAAKLRQVLAKEFGWNEHAK